VTGAFFVLFFVFSLNFGAMTRVLGLAFSLFLLISSAFATPLNMKSEEPAGFDVEIILFEQDAVALPESAESPPFLPNEKNVILAEPFKETLEFSVLDPSRFRLNREYNALKRQKKYRVLLHLAWHQSDSLKPIYLDSRRFQDALIEAKAPPIAELDGISGTIEIVKKRFFKLESDLTLDKPCKKEGDENARCYFPLSEERNLKNEEIHYLDHPLFGMLIKITETDEPSHKKA
jgi:hypothetical protein